MFRVGRSERGRKSDTYLVILERPVLLHFLLGLGNMQRWRHWSNRIRNPVPGVEAVVVVVRGIVVVLVVCGQPCTLVPSRAVWIVGDLMRLQVWRDWDGGNATSRIMSSLVFGRSITPVVGSPVEVLLAWHLGFCLEEGRDVSEVVPKCEWL